MGVEIIYDYFNLLRKAYDTGLNKSMEEENIGINLGGWFEGIKNLPEIKNKIKHGLEIIGFKENQEYKFLESKRVGGEVIVFTPGILSDYLIAWLITSFVYLFEFLPQEEVFNMLSKDWECYLENKDFLFSNLPEYISKVYN